MKLNFLMNNIFFFFGVGSVSRLQYFSLTPATANVPDIIQLVQEGFEKTELVLVQSNGLQIEDNAATRG